MSHISRAQDQIFQGVTNYQQTEDIQSLRQVNHNAVSKGFLCCGGSVNADRLAQTIHTYFGGLRYDGSEFMHGKAVRDLTTFQSGLRDIQRLKGLSEDEHGQLETVIGKVTAVIEQKTGLSEEVGSVAVVASRVRKKSKRKARKDKDLSRQPLLSGEPRENYLGQKVMKREVRREKPKRFQSGRSKTTGGFQLGMDPSRFIADEVIRARSTTTRTTTRVVPDEIRCNDVRGNPLYHLPKGVAVIHTKEDQEAFRPPRVFAPRHVEQRTVTHQTTNQDLLAEQRKKILGDKA